MTISAADFTDHEIGWVSLPPLGDGPRSASPYIISALTAPATMQSGTDVQLTARQLRQINMASKV